jgi:metal-sulfur cluster biosynthetic enzyme
MRTASPAAPLTEAGVLAALHDCYDPEIPANIVELGMVRSVSITPDLDAPGAGIPGVPARHRVYIALTLTSPDSLGATQIPAQIQNRLAGFESISHTEIEVVADPPWTPDLISPEARARLARNPQSPNGLIQIQTHKG